MRKHIGYLAAALLGALIGSAIPTLHAQGGYSPELREIQVNGVKVVPRDGAVEIVSPSFITYGGTIQLVGGK
jgi:hypothetical protein